MTYIHNNQKLPPKEKAFKCDHFEKMFYSSQGHMNENINRVYN